MGFLLRAYKSYYNEQKYASTKIQAPAKSVKKAPDKASGALIILLLRSGLIKPARHLLQELPQRELLQLLLRSLRDRWEQQP